MSTLHHTIVSFFEAKMSAHSRVERFTRLPIEDEFIYLIERNNNLGSLNVLLSDAYEYGRPEYLGRPRKIGSGDFILIAKPDAILDPAVVELAKKDRTGIGFIGKFMGALNFASFWDYDPPDRREKMRE
jgi:hypothetical protein